MTQHPTRRISDVSTPETFAAPLISIVDVPHSISGMREFDRV